MRTAETIALPDGAFASLAADSTGALWVGAPGALLRFESGSEPPMRIDLSAEGVPRAVGRVGDRMLFRHPAGLTSVALDGSTADSRGTETLDTAALDVGGRYIFTTRGAGTMVAHDPGTLEPIWGWASVGAPSHALALSPEGDRVYQPTGADEFRPHPEILIRDLLTGRIVERLATDGEVQAFVALSDGSLVGAEWEEEEGSLFRLVWRSGRLVQRWRRPLEDPGLHPPIRLLPGPGAESVTVLGGSESAGLHLIDVETGRSLDRARGPILDAAFDAAGRLWLLQPGALRRVE